MLNWLSILPWFWPCCCTWSLTFSHTLHPFNQQILLPLLQNLSETQALLTILTTATSDQTTVMSHLDLPPQPPHWCWHFSLSLRGVPSTPQQRFLFRECQTVSLLYSKLLSKVLLMIDITPYNLFPITPQTSSSLLWPHWLPHSPWTCQVSPLHIVFPIFPVETFFPKVTAWQAPLLSLGLFSKATFIVNLIWPPHLKSQPHPLAFYLL